MKNLFRTPKRAAVSAACLTVIVLAVLAAAVIVVSGRGIGKSAAAAVALADAGLKESEVTALRSRLEFDDGRFLYEVDFYSGGAEYEYVIQARDGAVLVRDIEGQRSGAGQRAQAQPAAQPTAQPAAQPATPEETSVPPQDMASGETGAAGKTDGGTEQAGNAAEQAGNVTEQVKNEEIGAERAKEIALDHAKLTESEVQFLRTEKDYDDGRLEYEVEFYQGRTEYSYTIDAVSGEILEYDVDLD